MTPRRPILLQARDVGGARAVLGVLPALCEAGVGVHVAREGYLAHHAPPQCPRVAAPAGIDEADKILEKHKFGAFLYATSITSPSVFHTARAAARQGVFTLHLLDNWMNYHMRLTMDGRGEFVPDCYAVMDELARQEAIADGVPAEILTVTGHPALAPLGEQWRGYLSGTDLSARRAALGVSGGKRLAVFVSEPAGLDQRPDPSNPNYRGYTERTVLTEVCRRLQPAADRVHVGVLPHPREDAEALLECWNRHAGKLTGGRLNTADGREAVFLADAVAGMTSILLYEAWLLRKPVASLQPGLRNDKLATLSRREGVHAVLGDDDWDAAMQAWLDEAIAAPADTPPRDDMKRHEQAPERIRDILLEHL